MEIVKISLKSFAFVADDFNRVNCCKDDEQMLFYVGGQFTQEMFQLGRTTITKRFAF